MADQAGPEVWCATGGRRCTAGVEGVVQLVYFCGAVQLWSRTVGVCRRAVLLMHVGGGGGEQQAVSLSWNKWGHVRQPVLQLEPVVAGRFSIGAAVCAAQVYSCVLCAV